MIAALLRSFGHLLEKDVLPDALVRAGIRHLLAERLRLESKGDPEAQQEHLSSFIQTLKASPIAVDTSSANQQHYEVPTRFYELTLGSHLKYSSGYWPEGVNDLDAAEEAMLKLTCQRAELTNGQQVLELGCGWGSLSLYMAARYPASSFVVVSNSRTQKQHIDAQAMERGLRNLVVVTADMNVFETEERFDRIVSVEMFEHMRNYERLLERLSTFMKPDGKMFIHIFTHREYAYLFEVKDETDWMSKYFFTGGMMPSDHLLLYFPEHFQIERHWRVSGTHYHHTAEAWLRRMELHREEILKIFAETYGADQALRWFSYWRIFFMSCAELWGYDNGREWFVSHYLFRVRR